MEFIQLVGAKVQVITLNGLEDSNATEESKLLTPCSWKTILESHGKRNYIPRPQKVMFNVIVTGMVVHFSNTRY